ncbi:glycosyltransferase family 2 protein [Gloeocapsa sp. PCC 73106]|uniref:glycosyltransferase family 2 protein n=1 Tax=Gloeocapsa sp. PCC 73106 TaxID=102232 RepID=UPI0002ABF2FA|nr:glycosyltransferase [Gloeocapsa sp. PCC 73106]ELR97380.1 putative glycosyltransferase [Gloeocapsa sp. PCC 73106]
MSKINDVQVTIVVVPRERFSYTKESLESIYEYTKEIPFKLVYVDGNSPEHIKRYLETQAKEKNFELIRTDYYLFPNRARNIGLSRVDTKYVALLDNDVIVSPGWLTTLVNCAEATNATVVGPLMCQAEPVHEEIHFAGGEAHIFTDTKGRTRLREKMYKQGQKVAKVLPKLERTVTELCEFHCALIRTKIFEQVGFFDEQILNTKEHVDFCMNVRKLGNTVYFEPESIVTYVPSVPLEWTDLHYYMLRWSDEWELNSLERLRQKWNLAEDMYFKQKYKGLGWRRRKTILQPLVKRLTFGNQNQFLNKLIMYGLFAPTEKLLNRFLTTRYSQRFLQQADSPKASSTVILSN